MKCKYDLEHFARQHGVKIKSYHADNHPFTSKEFLDDIERQEQTISLSGVGAHHQNAVAERAIQTVFSSLLQSHSRTCSTYHRSVTDSTRSVDSTPPRKGIFSQHARTSHRLHIKQRLGLFPLALQHFFCKKHSPKLHTKSEKT